MSALEDTAYNYGAEAKGRAMSDLGSVANTIRKLQAENDRLREALKAAQTDLAEWMETYTDDPGWRRSLVVMDQIETALMEEKT